MKEDNSGLAFLLIALVLSASVLIGGLVYGIAFAGDVKHFSVVKPLTEYKVNCGPNIGVISYINEVPLTGIARTRVCDQAMSD